MSLNTFQLVDILVLAGFTILPAPAVPASTRMSARLKHAGSIVTQVNMVGVALADTAPQSLGRGSA